MGMENRDFLFPEKCKGELMELVLSDLRRSTTTYAIF